MKSNILSEMIWKLRKYTIIVGHLGEKQHSAFYGQSFQPMPCIILVVYVCVGSNLEARFILDPSI